MTATIATASLPLNGVTVAAEETISMASQLTWRD